ncbi:hypothetical protein [Actinoplanes sp. M2I2]|uniref:hypothetical protein n=1 Tax=Actinoplanes sp. M2I2 TaxID=1734444 RepID=UPI002020A402|nr:hypothetical protein [Actinoplanes sp. M2I2]
MTTTIPFGAQLVGRTEKALNAILGRTLAGRGITEPQWVALTLTVTAGGADPAGLVAEALRVPEAVARERLGELALADLVRLEPGRPAEATARGRDLWQAVRGETGRIADDLWGDLPAGDRDAAARVLNVVLARAGAVLSADR